MTAWTDEELKSLALSRISKDTKFIGFSHLFSVWSLELEMYCDWIKEKWPHIKIISGSSVLPDFESKAIDYYIQGFAEVAIVELVSYLFSNGTRPRFDMDWMTRGKKIIKANDQYPAYPMKSLMIEYEKRDFIHPGEWLTIEFARGCKFQCAFCNFPILGVKGDYSRDASDAHQQLQKAYDEFGVTKYMISDETFNDRTEKITKFADVVDDLSFTPWFSGYVRADLLISRPKDREELLRMNLLGHFYGVESFNTPSSKAVGKGMDGDRMKQGLLEIKTFFKNHGRKLYRGNIALIVGLPHETPYTIEKTHNWLKDNWNDQSFDAWSLELPKGANQRESKISADLKKYQYTEMSLTADVLKKLYTNDIDLDLSRLIAWQNDHMNIFSAKVIANKLTNSILDDGFKAGPYTLSSVHLSDLPIEYTLQQSLKSLFVDAGYNYDRPDRSLKCLHVVNEYIYNKLSI